MGSRFLPTLFTLVLVLSACSSAGGSDEAENPQADSTSEHEMADSTSDSDGSHSMPAETESERVEAGDVISGSATGTSPCERSGAPASPGQTAGSHGERGLIVQAELDQATRLEMQRQQVLAREVANRFPTVADAQAGGYSKSTEYVTCIGAHYTNVALAARFDPAAPSELLYDGTTPESRVVGLSYLVWNRGGPPEGFAGSNDVWHQHNANGGLCLKGGVVIGAEATTEEECAELGGAKTPLEDVWMLHNWVVPGFECSWGVFSGECPELGGTTGADLWTE